MTAQISDTMLYNGNTYRILQPFRKELFDLKKYGIIPQMLSTACRDGYYCTFEIKDRTFLVQKVTMIGKSDNYPKLSGVAPTQNEYCTSYENLNLDVKYSGDIQIGREFAGQVHIQQTFRLPEEFNTVITFEIVNGRINSTN